MQYHNLLGVIHDQLLVVGVIQDHIPHSLGVIKNHRLLGVIQDQLLLLCVIQDHILL